MIVSDHDLERVLKDIAEMEEAAGRYRLDEIAATAAGDHKLASDRRVAQAYYAEEIRRARNDVSYYREFGPDNENRT